MTDSQNNCSLSNVWELPKNFLALARKNGNPCSLKDSSMFVSLEGGVGS